ncbi:MAG: hypothetical protein ACLS7Z_10840 [Christensenellales bacterium]
MDTDADLPTHFTLTATADHADELDDDAGDQRPDRLALQRGR